MTGIELNETERAQAASLVKMLAEGRYYTGTLTELFHKNRRALLMYLKPLLDDVSVAELVGQEKAALALKITDPFNLNTVLVQALSSHGLHLGTKFPAPPKGITFQDALKAARKIRKQKDVPFGNECEVSDADLQKAVTAIVFHKALEITPRERLTMRRDVRKTKGAPTLLEMPKGVSARARLMQLGLKRTLRGLAK